MNKDSFMNFMNYIFNTFVNIYYIVCIISMLASINIINLATAVEANIANIATSADDLSSNILNEASKEPSTLMSLAPLFMIMVVFYFLLIRPQQKRMKEHKNTISMIVKGDNVTTSGGIMGTVVKVLDNDILIVEIAPQVNVKVRKEMITYVTVKESHLANNLTNTNANINTNTKTGVKNNTDNDIEHTPNENKKNIVKKNTQRDKEITFPNDKKSLGSLFSKIGYKTKTKK